MCSAQNPTQPKAALVLQSLHHTKTVGIAFICNNNSPKVKLSSWLTSRYWYYLRLYKRGKWTTTETSMWQFLASIVYSRHNLCTAQAEVYFHTTPQCSAPHNTSNNPYSPTQTHFITPHRILFGPLIPFRFCLPL